MQITKKQRNCFRKTKKRIKQKQKQKLKENNASRQKQLFFIKFKTYSKIIKK